MFFSTVAVYGYSGDLYNHNTILTENSPCNPSNNSYAESKWEAEKILKKMEAENFIVSIIRPPMVYGKKAKGNMQRLINLIKKVPVLPFKYDKNKRSLVSIDNLLYLTYLVINKRVSGIFLPLDDRNLSLQEIFEGIEEALGKKRYNIKVPGKIIKIFYIIKPNITKRLYGSLQFENKKTKQELEYIPIIDYKEGIKKSIE